MVVQVRHAVRYSFVTGHARRTVRVAARAALTQTSFGRQSGGETAGSTMMSWHAADDDGVLVIRVWRDRGSDVPFRARITYGGDDHETAASASTSDPDAVVQAVRRWLRERMRDQNRPSDRA
jgi:hypothetical protein